MNTAALEKYHEAAILRCEASNKIDEGIACFGSLEDALQDAEDNIARTTKSDFTAAHQYEAIKSRIEYLLHNQRCEQARKSQQPRK